MGKDEKITSYASKVQKLVHLMKGYGVTLINNMIVEKLIRTLTSHFDHGIVTIQKYNNLETLKLEDLVGSLEVHEIRIVERKGVQDSIQELQAQSWKKSGGSNKLKGKIDKTHGKKCRSNPHKNKVNDRASESSKRGEGNSYKKYKEEKKGVQCYNYEKLGHLAKHYWYRKDKGSTKGKREGVNISRQHSDVSNDVMVINAITDDHVESNIWFLDSGCSNHMTSQKVWLVDFEESKKSKIKLVDSSSLQAEGTGNIVIQRSNGVKALIKVILYVPGMKCNLLSVR
ncbi:uncharacterized protein LOC127129779 [Lathyrus oleraceus]|uniref:uncharacterized protein LOC127129779 n=1 Tax=Pisum sativum TaxID=3888 RepID=UPI0021D1B331|nr:uncharacterized protein LOC127129779 [Pisum sativum]